jgi:ribosomal protein S12 methylthiotransferase
VEDLVENARKLATQGVRELILIAQDLTYYGLDLYKKRNLAELVEKLAEVEGIEWIRLHYAYPSGFPMDVLDVMKDNAKVCNYLDMPLQHVSSNVLKSMRRGIGREKTEALVAEIRSRVPGMALRTTMLVGYPGETEADFQELMDFIEKSRFERLGCFTYSHEENTHAFGLVDDVPEDVKQARADAIMELQSRISLELNSEKIGSVYKVLIDRAEGDFYFGRSEFDSPEVDNEVLIPIKDNYLRIGDFVNVRIEKADHYDLYGKVVA